MKNITAIMLTLFSVFTLSAHPEPCKADVSWNDEYLVVKYENGHIGEMKIIDYYSDLSLNLFIITAQHENGSLVKVSVKDYLLSYIISIEHNSNDGKVCSGMNIVSKYSVNHLKRG